MCVGDTAPWTLTCVGHTAPWTLMCVGHTAVWVTLPYGYLSVWVTLPYGYLSVWATLQFRVDENGARMHSDGCRCLWKQKSRCFTPKGSTGRRHEFLCFKIS